MKVSIHIVLMIGLCLLGSQALATNHNNGWNNSYKKSNNYQSQQQAQYNFYWSKSSYWNPKNSWSSASYNKGGYYSNYRGGGWGSPQAHSVPELDTNVAPLAGLLLSGLLAAGYERRRRKQLKTLKN